MSALVDGLRTHDTLPCAVQSLLQTRKFVEAGNLLRQQVSQSEDPQARILLGIAEEDQGNFLAAEEQFRLAAKSAPTEENLFAWGSVLLMLGRADSASDVFRTVGAQFPQSMLALVGLGAAFYENGSAAQAVKTWLRAANLHPSSPVPYTLMAKVLSTLPRENLFEADHELKALMKTAPDNPQANFTYACLLEAANGPAPDQAQSQEVENLLKRATVLDPAFAGAHFELGSFYAERGQYTLAIPEYRKAIEVEPELAEAHYRLGQAYMRTGHSDMAEQELAQHATLREAAKRGAEDQSRKVLKALATASRNTETLGSSPCPVNTYEPHR